jgi:hypothetical protein
MNSFTRVKANGIISEKIAVKWGVREWDSLSSLLANLVMNVIIRDVRHKMETKGCNIVCYADNAKFIAGGEHNLQRLLHQFRLSFQK